MKAKIREVRVAFRTQTTTVVVQDDDFAKIHFVAAYLLESREWYESTLENASVR